MDVGVILSPLQPVQFLVKGAKDERHALNLALEYAWKHYPGFFVDDDQGRDIYPYRDKALMPGYPNLEVIRWQ